MTSGRRVLRQSTLVRLDEGARASPSRSGQVLRLAPILLLMGATQLLDLVTFAFAVDRWGIQGELGPLGLVYQAAGYWAVAFVKTGLISLVMAAMVFYPWQRSVTAWRIGLVAAAIGAFGAATNVAALL